MAARNKPPSPGDFRGHDASSGGVWVQQRRSALRLGSARPPPGHRPALRRRFRFDYLPALDEIHRVLEPGGHLVTVWNVKDGDAARYRRYMEIVDRHADDTPRHADMRWRRAIDAPHRAGDRLTGGRGNDRRGRCAACRSRARCGCRGATGRTPNTSRPARAPWVTARRTRQPHPMMFAGTESGTLIRTTAAPTVVHRGPGRRGRSELRSGFGRGGPDIRYEADGHPSPVTSVSTPAEPQRNG